LSIVAARGARDARGKVFAPSRSGVNALQNGNIKFIKVQYKQMVMLNYRLCSWGGPMAVRRLRNPAYCALQYKPVFSKIPPQT
jgi:hypothetical protein